VKNRAKFVILAPRVLLVAKPHKTVIFEKRAKNGHFWPLAPGPEAFFRGSTGGGAVLATSGEFLKKKSFS
jgi:hypothetical protein